MKNIHLLPTDKPSRIKQEYTGKASYCLSRQHLTWRFAQHIYITSDEEIKEGGYVFWEGKIYTYREFMKMRTPVYTDYFSIILTTDKDLIADGVQAIDDEFLEWFVENPTCEFVDVIKEMYVPQSNGRISDGRISHEISLNPSDNTLPFYKIIIPQEEQYLDEYYKQVALLKDLADKIKSEQIIVDKEEQKELRKKLLNLIDMIEKDDKSLEEPEEDLVFPEGYYDFKFIKGEKIEDAAKRFWKESTANPIEMAIFGAKWQSEQDKNDFSEEEVFELTLKALAIGMTIRQDQLKGYSEKSGTELHKEWFEQFKKK
jgi:hypothetical protein